MIGKTRKVQRERQKFTLKRNKKDPDVVEIWSSYYTHRKPVPALVAIIFTDMLLDALNEEDAKDLEEFYEVTVWLTSKPRWKMFEKWGGWK